MSSNFNQAKVINVYYNKGDRKPYDITGKPIAYIGEEAIGATEATTIRFYLGEDIDSSTAVIVTKRPDGERRLDICQKFLTGANSYYEVTLNEWYGAVKGKATIVFKAYNGTVTFDDNENPTEITTVSGRVVVSDIFNLEIRYAPEADLVVPPDDTQPYADWFFALSTKLDKADSITVAGALPTLTGGVYDDRYFYIEDEGVGRLYYIDGSTAEEVVFQVGTLKLTATGNGELTTDTGKLSWEQPNGTVKVGLYNNINVGIGEDVFYYGKASANITKGQAIQFAGREGDHILIKPAVQAEVSGNNKLIMGIAKQDITNGDFGYVLHFGKLDGIDTGSATLFPSQTLVAGDLLWFHSSSVTNGALTKVQPTAPNAKILMAAVVKLENGNSNNGVLQVRISVEPRLSEIQDVILGTLNGGEVLRYDNANNRWGNSSDLTTAEQNITEILNGTQIVGKAINDQNGDEIDTTYLKVATATSTYVPLSSKGIANGVAPLGSDNKIPSIHLPGGVDDIKEFANLASFPLVGEASIIYVALDTNKIYRWGGSAYVEISSSLALGTTNTTAFPGDRGLATETKTDNIVSGVQGLTDTRITNSAIGVQPLIVNGLNGTTTDLQRWQVNGATLAGIDQFGIIRTEFVRNLVGSSRSVLNLDDNGAIISRNVADANHALRVNLANAGSTGDILRLQFAGANKLEITKDGFINQNGTRLFHQTGGSTNTFFGASSGSGSVSNVSNSGFGQFALQSLTSGISNTALGRYALGSVQTSSDSTGVGTSALINASGGGNTAVGRSSGNSLTTGTNNLFLGYNAGNNASQLATATNSTAVGFEAYTDKSNQMVFGNASVSEILLSRNTGDIKVGLGITSPLYPLHVQGNTVGNHVVAVRNLNNGNLSNGAFWTLNDLNYSSRVFKVSSTYSYKNITANSGGWYNDTNGGDLAILNDSTTGKITFVAGGANSTGHLVIATDGKVGIGTSSPAHLLSVVSGSNTQGFQIRRDTTTTNEYALLGFRVSNTNDTQNFAEIRGVRTNRAVTLDHDLSFHTYSNGTLGERMRIRDDGLVGINETSFTTNVAQLVVKSGATNRIGLIVDSLTGQTANLQEWRVNGSQVFAFNANGVARIGFIANASSSNNANIEFTNNGAIIRRNINDANPALIVNLENASATGNIQVWQKAGVAKAHITNNGGASFTDGVETKFNLQVDMETSAASDAIYVYESVSSNDLFYVQADGDAFNVNGTYGTISDIRLKENIIPARNYIEDLMKLNVVKYSFKKDHSDKPTHLGFIAQEFEQVFPNLVETRKTKELDDQKQIKMSVLIPMLVKVIQEQQKQIDELIKKVG